MPLFFVKIVNALYMGQTLGYFDVFFSPGWSYVSGVISMNVWLAYYIEI
jgi:hypothetical protein